MTPRPLVPLGLLVLLAVSSMSMAGCDCAGAAPSEPAPSASETAEGLVLFELAGAARVRVPSHFEDVEGEAREALRAKLGIGRTPGLALALRQDPATEAIVSLQHERTPLVVTERSSVGAYLGELLDEMMARDGQPGATTGPEADIPRRCVADVPAGLQFGAGSRVSSCIATHLDAQSREIVVDIASCVGRDAELCQAVIASFEVEGDPVPAGEVLEPTAVPGIEEVSATGFGWIRLGSSVEEFRASCAAAGQEVADERVAELGHPSVRAEIAAGRFSVCGGPPWPTSLGPIRSVEAMFRSGRLTNAGLFVLAPVAEVGPRVEAAYPDYLFRQGMAVHFVDRDAAGDATMAVYVAPSREHPGQTLLQVVSARELED